MSTMSSLLLSLLFLGVVQAQVASDGSEFTAKSFIDVLRNAIEHKETEHLNKIISNQFIFIGCTKNVGKDELLKMLSMIPAGNKAAFKFQSSQFLNEKKNQIAYSVAVSGLGINLNANFVIDSTSGNWVLIKGNAPNCPRHLFLVADPAESIAKSFLAQFQKAILSKDGVKIARSISENFLFHGCKGDYTKAKVLGLLASIPKGSKVSMTLKHADYVNGGDVQYTVSVTGFGRPTFDAQFVLHEENGDYVLIGGKVSSCPSRRIVLARDESNPIALKFVESLVKFITAKDQANLAAIFSDDFVLHGCKGDYTKEKSLAIFSRIPNGSPIAFTFQSSKFINGSDIQFSASVSGFGGTGFVASFTLHKENGQYVLIGGKVTKCSSRLFYFY